MRDLSERPRALIAVAALLVLTIIVLGSCGGDGGQPSTIASSDGLAVLEIPDGALPEGVNLDDIRVRSVLDDLDILEQAGGPLAAVYAFEPDGLGFLAPVTLRIQLPPDRPSDAITVVHAFKDDAEIITDLAGEIDPETNVLTASMSLTHFSFVYVWYHETVFEIEGSASATQVHVGDTFTVTFIVTRTVDPTDPTRGLLNTLKVATGEFYEFLADAPWTLRGEINASGPVTPTQVQNAPPLSSISTPTFTVPPAVRVHRAGEHFRELRRHGPL